METVGLSKIISELVEKVTLKELSTRDFVEEMKKMYDRIDKLEQDLELAKRLKESASTEFNDLCIKHSQYEKDFVIPAKEYEKRRSELENSNKDWQLEKKYIEKQDFYLREIIKQLTAVRTVSEGGGYRNEFVDKPNLN